MIAIALAGCATVDDLGRKTMAKGAAKPGGFLAGPGAMRELRERDPYHRVWYEHDFSFDPYTRIIVAAVDTSYVRELNLWAQMSIATPGIEEEVEGLAVELRETFVDAIRDDPNRRLELVEGIAEHTLVLEMALIEVVPNKAWLGALGLAAYGSPNVPAGVAVGTLATFFDRGWVSIEGRLRDAITGRVLYQFADSEMGKTRILDLEVLMWYGHADEIFRDWAVQFVERINKPLNEVVADSPWFTLRPW